MSRRLNIGEQLGDYQIVGFLGKGGMGAVYHAVHNKIGRAAAIKVLTEPAGSSTFKERFFNEARVQSSLHHPNIATLYDFQEHGDLLYIVMEYVDGETLEPLIQRKFFAVEDALKTFEAVCDAVAFIHSNNIVHRDIKPQNIKLASNGKVKLLDFGIAKGEASAGLTRVGGIIGTPNYLAPEQLKGEQASQASDIWALGVLLYEMLTGVGPFKGTTLEQLHVQITTAKFEEPEKINPAVTPEVSKIVGRCLAADRRNRYQSVNELLADIRLALRRYQPQEARKPALGEVLRRFAPKPQPKPQAATPNNESAAAEPAALTAGLPLMPIVATAGGALLVFVVIAIAIWAMSGPEDSGNAGGANRSASPQQNTKPSTPRIDRVTTQSGQPTETGRPRVAVDISEGSAEVWRDGQMIGRTPVELEGTENETVYVTLKRAGYEDQTVPVEITTRKKVVTFSMKKLK
jgi:eukaryotic-like serine/threonine-protein kinase